MSLRKKEADGKERKNMRDKKVAVALIFTAIGFIAQFIDVLFIHSEQSLFAGNIIARVLGIVLAILGAKILNFDLKKHCFNTVGYGFEILFGFAFAAVPIGFCYFLEFLYFKIKDYSDIVMSFGIPNISAFENKENLFIPILLYTLSLLLGVIFKEVFFRGYLITQCNEKFGFFKANIIQSVLYAAFSIPTIIFSFISGKFSSQSLIIIIYMVIAYPLNNFICGIKWGYFYRVNGTIWMSITDHFVNNFLLTCVYVSSDRLPEKWLVAEVFFVQIISILIFLPLYAGRDKVNTLLAEDAKIGREVLKAENIPPSENEEDVVSLSAIKAGISSHQDKEEHVKIIKRKEEPKIDKEEAEIDIEAKKFQKSDAVISNMMKQKSPQNEQTKSEKKEDISKLVNDYFNKEFDKHTFH